MRVTATSPESGPSGTETQSVFPFESPQAFVAFATGSSIMEPSRRAATTASRSRKRR